MTLINKQYLALNKIFEMKRFLDADRVKSRLTKPNTQCVPKTRNGLTK